MWKQRLRGQDLWTRCTAKKCPGHQLNSCTKRCKEIGAHMWRKGCHLRSQNGHMPLSLTCTPSLTCPLRHPQAAAEVTLCPLPLSPAIPEDGSLRGSIALWSRSMVLGLLLGLHPMFVTLSKSLGVSRLHFPQPQTGDDDNHSCLLEVPCGIHDLMFIQCSEQAW